MKISFPANYSGYVPVLRSVFSLVQAQILSFSEVSAYLYFMMQADFDKRHKYYATILRSDAELASEFKLNPSTIYRYRKSLIEKGLLIEKNGVTKISNFHIFELEHVKKLVRISSSWQCFLEKDIEDCESFENFIANMQQHQTQNAAQSSNVSSNGVGLSEDDKEWINNNL